MATMTTKGYIIVSLVLCFTLLLAYLDFKLTLIPRFSKHTGNVSESIFIRKYDIIYQPSKRTTKQILLWTGYFDSPQEWSALMSRYLSGCPNPCSVTTNRNNLAISDVVMFHDTNIDFKNLPGMRILRQPWVLFTMEPTALIKKNYKWFHKVFNWTMSYRNHSTILGDYGNFRLNANVEMGPVTLKNKTKTMFAVISNCHDAGRRFKLIKEISKYFDVDQYGRCSKNKCVGNHGPCLPKEQLDQYKFKLAFENSNCRNYVTEKYWQTLESNSTFIPIVNWVKGQMHPNVIPGSYINIYDFDSMEDFVKHIKQVSSNETMFQEYFKWRNKYGLNMGSGMYCKVCDALHQPYQAQVYDDLGGWFKDDTCFKYSLSGMTGRWIERRIFNLFNA